MKQSKNKVFIIAEIGVNHNGSIKKAKKMIDVAKEAGCDAVKFQSFKAENIVCQWAQKASYQKKATSSQETQLSMLKRVELDHRDLMGLKKYCSKKKIQFLSSPFDAESLDSLKKLGVKMIKIPSGEIENLPLLEKIGRMRGKVILSTGISTLKEIDKAIKILVSAGTRKKDITVLHCNTEYPTPITDVNLKAMLTIKDKLNVNVGYSDHTLGINVPIAAAALGATVIEKHFTMNRDDQGPDHKASLEPHELKEMVAAIRDFEEALGDGVKRPSKSELKNKKIVRRSIVAKRDIAKGEVLSEENLCVKRPEGGLSPLKWHDVLGKKAIKNFKADEFIKLKK